MSEKYRSGYVALIGPPNVGKSTLLNYLAGEKISIVSPRPQTTRFLIRAIITLPESQIIFVDTPGMVEGKRLKTPAEKFFVTRALDYLEEVDLIVLMVAPLIRGKEESFLLEKVRETGKKTILAINKIDKADKEEVEKLMEEYNSLYPFHRIIPISAKKGTNVSILVGEIILSLPERPPLYPQDMKTDFPLQIWMGELIREKIFHLTQEEIPYATFVKVEEIEERGKVLYIKANIFTEQPSQKGILIGKKGSMIKRIGEKSRKELEDLLRKKIYLDLEVKVKKKWRYHDWKDLEWG